MLAELYYAYQIINHFIESGHCSINGASELIVIFNASRFLANMLNKPMVHSLLGLDKVYIYYALAKVAN